MKANKNNQKVFMTTSVDKTDFSDTEPAEG